MDKLKKIIFTILGALMLLKLLGLNVDVFALEGSYNYYTQTGYYYEYTENNIEGYESNKYFDVEDLSNTGAITGSTDATLKQKNNYVNGDVKTDYLARFRLRIYGNSDSIYEKDNSYTFRFSFNFRYIQNVNSSLETNFYTLLQNKYYIETVTGNTSASSTDASSDYISSFSYYWTKPDTTGRYFLFVNVVPAQDLKFIQFYLKQKVDTNIYINDCVFGSYNIGGLQVTYQEGLNAVINEQTNTIINQTNKINTTIQELMDIFKNDAAKTEETLTDDTPPDDEKTSAFVDGIVGYLPPGPIDSILTLPLTFLNAYMSGLSGNCQPVNLQLPYVDEQMQLSCPNTILTKIDGFGTLYDFIGIVASSYILLKYLMSLYVWVDRTLTFRENNEPGYFDEP